MQIVKGTETQATHAGFSGREPGDLSAAELTDLQGLDPHGT